MSEDRLASRPGLRFPRLAGAVVLFGAMQTGCVVGPDFKRPAAPETKAYLPAAAAVEGAPTIALGQAIPAQWWGLFHNPKLDELVRQAIAGNNTLTAAKATLAQAQEEILVARAGLYPAADLSAGARRGTTGPGGGVNNLFSIGPSVSYSVDAFGGIRRRVEQAGAQADNQRYQLAAAYLTLTGNSVSEAITLAATRLELATVEDLIKNDEKNLDLVQREFNGGKVAKTDVLTAAAQLEGDRTQLPALHQQLNQARHALAVLVGKAPADWLPPDFAIAEFTLPDTLPVSLPSEFVHQRPDILAAEAELHADSAAIGVAAAAEYPAITLSANLLQDSVTLARLLRSASRTWSVGGSVDAPLYRGGSLSAQRRAAIDAYDAQLATYRQTVVQAFGQVADALSALEHDAEMVAATLRSLDIASQSLELQRKSYVAGKTSALQLIVAENTYSSARLAYVRAISQRLTDTAQLFIAVGGGWWNGTDLVPAANH